MKIPTQNQWTQTNEGDILGVLHDTRNITIDQAGKVRLTKKAFSHISSSTTSNFANVFSILYYDGAYIILTDDEVFRYNLSTLAVTEVSSTPALVSEGDALVFNDLVYVSRDTDVANWDGTTWNNSVITGLTTGLPHPLAVFDSNPTYKLAVADGNTIDFYDTSHNKKSESLVLPTQFTVTTMRYRSGYLYVGTKNNAGGEARVFIFNGDGTFADYEVPMGGEYVFSMTEYGSTVACIVDTGELALINGTTKLTLAGLPVFYQPEKRWASGTSARVSNRGMETVGDTIYLNIDGDLYGDSSVEMRSGLWAYNPRSGLNHQSGYSTDVFVKDEGLSLADSTLTTSVDHNLITGDSVFFQTSQLTGIDTGVAYYVSVVSNDEIKLALSRASLEAGDFVEITGTPSSLDDLVYVPNTDYGEHQNTSPGAIGRMSRQELPSAAGTWLSDIFFAGRSGDNDANDPYILCGLVDAYNIGSLTTQRVYSDNITQSWKDFYTFIDGVNLTGEEAVVKYRTEQKQSKPTNRLSGIWSETNVINSDTSKSDEDDWRNVEKGDEVFVAAKYGQGRYAQIIDLKRTATVTIITLDETFGKVGSAVDIIVDSWNKGGVITNTRKERDYLKTSITPAAKGAWFQSKTELRGFQTKVAHYELTHSVDKSAV